jgi:tetratricopeptide (TPR) repeat protein
MDGLRWRAVSQHWVWGLPLLVMLFSLFLAGPTLWARGHLNLFSRELTRLWTAETLSPGEETCHPSASSHALEGMAAHLQAAAGRIPHLERQQGQLACLQGDEAAARAYWAQGLAQLPADPLLTLFASVSMFPETLPVSADMEEALARYAYHMGTRLKTSAPTRAIGWFRYAMAYEPSIAAAGQLARLYDEMGQEVRVSEVWLTLKALSGEDTPAHWWAVGKLREQDGDLKGAAEAYARAAALSEGKERYRRTLTAAETWRRAGEADRAIAIYRQLIREHPDKIDAYLGLAGLYRIQRAWEDARFWYEEAQQRFPQDFRPYYYLGVTARAEGRFEEALTYLEQALAIKPQHAPAMYELAMTLDSLNRRPEAVVWLQQAVEAATQPPKMWGQLLERWQRYPDREKDPNIWAAQAREAEKAGELQEAERLFEKAASLAQGEDAYPFWLKVGGLRIRLKDYAGAEEAYRKALALKKDAVQPYLGIGDSYRYRGEYEEAEAWYRQAQAVDPEHPSPPYLLGVTLYHQQRYEEALSALDLALEKNPDNAWGEYFRALTLRKLGRQDEAIASLRRAIELHPKQPQSWKDMLASWQAESQ